ncbi:unnamed protein product [Mucor hiemalis]
MIEGKITARDWQGTPIPLENFNIRFKPINKLDEPNHRAVMKLVQDEVKQKGEQYEGLVEEIRSRQDVTDEYLNTPLDTLTPWYANFKTPFHHIEALQNTKHLIIQ